MQDCIFCKIIKGEIPCYKIYEDDQVLAFLDIAKDAYGYIVVTTKSHCKNILDAKEQDLKALILAVQKISQHLTQNCGFDGVNLINNSGEASGQSVSHIHFHIFPRHDDDGLKVFPEFDGIECDLQEVCEKLKVKQELEDVGDKQKVVLYTDGACSGNPGLGGYGAILLYNGKEKIISGGEENTTNNRMELMAVIKGLEAIKVPCQVDVFSDSAYVVNAFLQNWIGSWQAKGWKTSSGSEVLNIDLWKRLLVQVDKHKVAWHKVKGHADNELNNKCDELARNEIEKLR